MRISIVIRVLAFLALGTLWYQTRVDSLVSLFLGISFLDTVISKIDENKDRGELVKIIDKWHPTMIRRKTSIILTSIVLLIYTIISTMGYIKGQFMLGEFIVNLVIFDGFLIGSIYYSLKPFKVYRRGMQLGFYFVEWENIDLGDENNGETLIEYRTKRMLFPTETRRLLERP